MPSFLPPRRRRCARLDVAALEDRTLLSHDPGPFADFSGTVNGPHGQATIPITISPADFHLAAHHVLLGLDMETPDRLQIGSDGRESVRTLADRAGSGYRLVELSAGTYALHVTAKGSAGESYGIAVSLAGATSGFQVGPQDLATIRGLEGQRRSAPGYVAAADVNHDGVVNARDLRLAQLNLGAVTTIRPLVVTLGLGAAVATTASGAVYQPSVIVAGQTAPGAALRLGPQTATADDQGHYQFTINAAVGPNSLRTVATDGFGQRASATLTVTRVVDTKPPAIAIQTPTAGLTTNANVLVSGTVTDDLSGVAMLQEQVDSGPFQAVAVDPAGHFVLVTALPLNGAADGMHTVHLRAIDAAGNASDALASFGLDTTGPSITIASPGPDAAVSSSPVVTGQVSDNLAGVATLEERVDSGAWQTLPLDAAGRFSVATALPLDGTADGPHAVILRATDRAGNVSEASTAFTLTTTLVNQAVTSDPGVQQMPSIAADPLDPMHLVLAYMDYSLVKTGYAGIGVAVSHDSGADWQYTSVPLPAGFNQGAANPIVKFDGQGHVFVSFLAATFLGPPAPLTNANFSDRGIPGEHSNNGVFVARSDDGGLTWNQPVAVISHLYAGQPVDFETIPDFAIDTFRTLPDGLPNPHFGEMYAVWTRVYAPGHYPDEPNSTGGTDIMLAASTDGGATWQLRLETDPVSGLPVTTVRDPLLEVYGDRQVGFGVLDQAHITIGPEGDVYVSNVAGGDFEVQHSTDDGQTFSVPDHGTGVGLAFGTGFESEVLDSGLPTDMFRTNAVRAIAADPSRPGTIYATEAIDVIGPLGGVIDPANIEFARSNDYGQTWQTTFQVGPFSGTDLNDDNQEQPTSGSPDDVISGQALPRLAVDAQGNIAVVWYDTRRDPANHLLDVFGAVSTDGGHTFSPNFRVSSQSFDANTGKFTDAVGQTDYYIGDFLGLSVAGGVAYAAWADTRGGNQDVEFTHFPVSPAAAAPNDRFEPNETAQAATDLGKVTTNHLPKLSLPAGDNDWFRVTAASTGNVTVTATPADPRLNLEVQLWDASGTTLLATGSAVAGGSAQQLVHAGPSGASYLIHVGPGAASTATSTEYSLDITALAANLGTLVEAALDGSLQPGDQAYDRLVVAASGSLAVTLTPGTGLSGHVTLQVLDPVTQTVLATGSPGPGGVLAAGVAVQQGQAVLVAVTADPATAGTYRLEFTNRDQASTPDSTELAFPAGAGPSTLAAGDLNGDGKPDLVVADALSNTISVLLGNGDGTYQAPRQFAIGAFKSPSPVATNAGLPNFRRQVVIADFNRDGIPDVAVTNFDSGDISVLLGRGDGTFEPQRRFNATTAPVDLTVGDFNGDGIPDLVAIDSQGDVDSTVAILLGRGDGTFLPERTFAALTGSGYPYSTVTVADLNHDGKADLVVTGSNRPTISSFLGNGDGTFVHAGDSQGLTLAGGAAVVDLNGDGIPDVITTGHLPDNIGVGLGNGDGTFAPVTTYTSGQGPIAIAVADLGSEETNPDGSTSLGPPDGHPDLVVADALNGGNGRVTLDVMGVYLLPGLVDDQGNFAGFGSPILLTRAVTPQSPVVGDFTGNGATELAFVDQDGVHVIYQKPPAIPPDDTPQAARDLGTVVHIVEPTETIVPSHEDAYYNLTVPTETAHGAGEEIIDFSGDFQATTGAGLMMEVRDAAGNLLGAGARFQISALQGETLTLHVFGATASDGSRGVGAYTLDVDVLPQVVSVEAQTLLPGQGGLPGGATASLVVTLQGDRLDPATAEDPANYTVTWLGPDGKAGTADDQVIPLATGFQSVVYDPSANIDVASGKIHPTAVRQTVTLLFGQPLPAGSYQVTLAPAIQAAPFTADEASLLSGGTAFTGHPVASLAGGTITSGSVVTATDLVLQSGALGNLNTLKAGNAFLTQLHDDLSAVLDAQKTQQGGQAQITPALIDQVLNRLEQGLGAPRERTTTAVALVFDPVSIGVDDPGGGEIDSNLDSDTLTDTTMDTFVDVDANIEVVILFDPPATAGDINVTVSDVPPDASGAAVVLSPDADTTIDLTDDLDAGMTQFDIPPD
jgi:hypothetical protein